MTPTPDDEAGRITELIMEAFSSLGCEQICALEPGKYNPVYSHVYKVLSKELSKDGDE